MAIDGSQEGFFLPQSCDIDPPRDYYYPQRWFNGVYGFAYGFAQSAAIILQTVIKPMDRVDNQRLYYELQNQENGIGPLLSIGANKGRFIEGQYYLFIASALTVLVGVSAFMNKLFKNMDVPIKKDLKSRARMLPLLFVHVPLVLLACVLVFTFTSVLWPSYENRNGDNESTNALKYIDRNEPSVTSAAKCEYENLIVRGKHTMDRLLVGVIKNASIECHAEEDLRSHLALISHDADAIDEAIEAGEHLMIQMGVAKKQGLLKQKKDINELDYAILIVNKTMIEMKLLRKALDTTVYTNYARILNDHLKLRKIVDDKVKAFVDETKLSLNMAQIRFKTVASSLENAAKEIISWVRLYAKRMESVKRDIQGGKNPLPYYIAVQAVVCIAGFFAITGLCLGFGTFAIGLIYPPSFAITPSFVKWMRRYLFVAFTALGFCAIIIFLFSGIALRFVAPTTSVCQSLTSFHYDNSSSDGMFFYADNQADFNITTFNGRTHIISMGEFLGSEKSSSLATKYGNGREDLVPERATVNVMEQLAIRIENIEVPEIKDILTQDFTRLSRPLALNYVALEEADISESLSIQSQFVSLISKELRTYKRLLAGLEMKSLKETNIGGCGNVVKMGPTLKEALKRNFDSTFETYRQRLSNNLFHMNRFVLAYQGAGSDYCVQWRHSAAGVWLAALLFGTLLTMTMTTLYKVSNRLYIEEYQSFVPETDCGGRSALSTALLVDDNKSIDSSVCDA